MDLFTKQQSQQIKGGGVTLLLFHHLFYNPNIFEPAGITSRFISNEKLAIIGTAARVCVWIFAFVSAYGITTLYKKEVPQKSICRFTFDRWRSLMKGYWFLYPFVFAALELAGKERFASFKYNLFYVLVDWVGWSDFFKMPTLMGGWWYITFAQILVVVCPLLITACRKFNLLMIPFTIFITQYLGQSGIVSNFGGAYLMYVLAIVFGILCAENSDRLAKELEKRKHLVLPGCALIFVVSLMIRYYISLEEFPFNNRYSHWFLASLAAVAFAISFAYSFDGKLAKAISFVGRHSGNMFLIHVVFRDYARGFVYATKSPFLSLCTLFAMSLLTSVAIEGLKKAIVRTNEHICTTLKRID